MRQNRSCRHSDERSSTCSPKTELLILEHQEFLLVRHEMVCAVSKQAEGIQDKNQREQSTLTLGLYEYISQSSVAFSNSIKKSTVFPSARH